MSVNNLPDDFYQKHAHFLVYVASGNTNQCLAALHDRFGETKNVGLIASSNQDIGEAAHNHFADSSIKFVTVYNSRIFNSDFANCYPIVIFDDGVFSVCYGDEAHAFRAEDAFALAPDTFDLEQNRFLFSKAQLLDYARTIAFNTFHNLCKGNTMNPYSDPLVIDGEVEARLEYETHYDMRMSPKPDNCK